MVDHPAFERFSVQLLAISADNPFSQMMFATSMALTYPLLSDHPHLEVIQHYGVLKHIGGAKRPVARAAYFLIDTKGIVRGKWLGEPGKVFPNATLLQGVHEHLN